MIKIGLKGLRVCGFLCAAMRLAILAMYFETVLSYFADVSAKRYCNSQYFLKAIFYWLDHIQFFCHI